MFYMALSLGESQFLNAHQNFVFFKHIRQFELTVHYYSLT